MDKKLNLKLSWIAALLLAGEAMIMAGETPSAPPPTPIFLQRTT